MELCLAQTKVCGLVTEADWQSAWSGSCYSEQFWENSPLFFRLYALELERTLANPLLTHAHYV